jgi:diguanylate cyclase (GGDEF)-like protein
MGNMHINKFNSFFRLGVRQKVLLILLSVLLISLTISGWLALQKEKKDVMAEIAQRGTDISRFVGKSLAYSVVGYDYHTLQLLVDEIATSDDIDYAKVENAKGIVMAQSTKKDNTDESATVIFSEKIILDGNHIGMLHLGLSTKKTLDRLESKKYTLVTREAVIILFIALGEFLALSYIIIRPVSLISKSLTESLDERGRITGKLPVLSDDEFGTLAHQFNQLSDQLNDANVQLYSKIDITDTQLRKTNEQLIQQSAELNRINEELKHMSVTDSLTGLYNRRHFDNIIDDEISMSLRHGDVNSLILIDIDHFKKINDNHGHNAGDIVLKEIANILKAQLRKTDVLCRIGGEEFIILCKRIDKKGAIKIADNLRKKVEQREFIFNGVSIKSTISAGISTIPNNYNASTPEELYHCADIALYISKENGRNRTTHYEDRPQANTTV